MSYRKDPIKSFAEYQVGEGFGQAVNGQDLSTQKAAKIGMTNAKALPGGLQNYENYESQQFAEVPANFKGASNGAILGLNGIASNGPIFQGFDDSPADSGDAFDGVKDDAFAGYATDKGIGGDVELSDERNEEALNFNGYGALSDSPIESFHTFFHQAVLANTENDVIAALVQAVKSVPDDAPDALKKKYYELIEEMLKKKKHGDLRHLDLQRVEIESNIGWLINSKLPKTGGFNAMLKVAAGQVGSKLAQGDSDQQKMVNRMALGKKLQSDMKKYDAKQASKLSGLGDFSGSNLTYMGLVLIGLAIVGAAYLFLKPKALVPARKRKNKRK